MDTERKYYMRFSAHLEFKFLSTCQGGKCFEQTSKERHRFYLGPTVFRIINFQDPMVTVKYGQGAMYV